MPYIKRCIRAQVVLAEPLNIYNDVHQRNVPTCLLFNVALEKYERNIGLLLNINQKKN